MVSPKTTIDSHTNLPLVESLLAKTSKHQNDSVHQTAYRVLRSVTHPRQSQNTSLVLVPT